MSKKPFWGDRYEDDWSDLQVPFSVPLRRGANGAPLQIRAEEVVKAYPRELNSPKLPERRPVE